MVAVIRVRGGPIAVVMTFMTATNHIAMFRCRRTAHVDYVSRKTELTVLLYSVVGVRFISFIFAGYSTNYTHRGSSERSTKRRMSRFVFILHLFVLYLLSRFYPVGTNKHHNDRLSAIRNECRLYAKSPSLGRYYPKGECRLWRKYN